MQLSGGMRLITSHWQSITGLDCLKSQHHGGKGAPYVIRDILLFGANELIMRFVWVLPLFQVYPSPIYEEMERIEKEIEQIKGIEEKAGLLKQPLTEYEMLRARLEIIKNTIGEDYIATGLVARE